MANVLTGSGWIVDEIEGAVAAYATDSSGNVTGLVGPSGGVIPVHRGNAASVGTKLFSMYSASSAMSAIVPSAAQTVGQPITFGAAMELETEYEWVRLVLLNNSAATVSVLNATCSNIADLSTTSAQINNTGFAAPSAFLFNGLATATLAAGTVNNPSLTFSDRLWITSTARIDGGTRPAIGTRVAFAAGAGGAAGTNLPYWNRSGTDWSTGACKFYSYQAPTATDTTTGVSSAGTATFSGNSPIFGIQYGSRRGVMSTLWVGDSITGSANLTNKKARGFAAQSCIANSTVSRPVEFSVLGLSGASIISWRTFLETAYSGATGGATEIAAGATNLDVLQPSHLVMSAWAVNNAPTATISQAQINTMRQENARMIALAKSKGITPVLWGGIPRGNGTPFYDATDVTMRQAYVADSTTWGWFATDVSSGLGTAQLGSAQGISAAYTADGVHINDAGDSVVAANVGVLVAQAALSYFA